MFASSARSVDQVYDVSLIYPHLKFIFIDINGVHFGLLIHIPVTGFIYKMKVFEIT